MDKYFIGIDLGGTRVKVGLVSGGRVIARRMVSPGKGLAETLPLLRSVINELVADATLVSGSGGKALAGVGLAFAGLADPVAKRILSTNKKYDDARDVDLEAWVASEWGCEFFIDNDARMAAVGEWKYGAGRGVDDLVAMTIGTGIGTSVIMEGRLLRGRHFQAGCLGGHFSVQYNGRVCTCGNPGCMEAYGATWGLDERIRGDEGFARSLLGDAARLLDGGVDRSIGFLEVFDAADKGDTLARRVLDECRDVWAAGIVNMIHAYDPEVVVIGGGVMARAADILPYVTERVHAHAWTPWGKVELRVSALLEDAGILGVVYCLEHGV